MIQAIKKFFGLFKTEKPISISTEEMLNKLTDLRFLNGIPENIKNSSEYKELSRSFVLGNVVSFISPEFIIGIMHNAVNYTKEVQYIYWMQFNPSSGKIVASYSENGNKQNTIKVTFALLLLEFASMQLKRSNELKEQEQKEFEENKRILLGLGDE